MNQMRHERNTNFKAEKMLNRYCIWNNIPTWTSSIATSFISGLLSEPSGWLECRDGLPSFVLLSSSIFKVGSCFCSSAIETCIFMCFSQQRKKKRSNLKCSLKYKYSIIRKDSASEQVWKNAGKIGMSRGATENRIIWNLSHNYYGIHQNLTVGIIGRKRFLTVFNPFIEHSWLRLATETGQYAHDKTELNYRE